MTMRRLVVPFLVFLVVFLVPSFRVSAQTTTTGDVTGTVTDPSGAVVPDAKASLKDLAKGTTQDTKTGREGTYRFYLLQPGSYTLTVTASGFQTSARPVQVAVGQVATVDVQLAVGLASQTVTVTELAPLVQAENGNVTSAISEQQVSEVPNPGNDMSYIAQLAPGSVMNTGFGFGNFSSYGTPGTSNLFTVNGMDDNDPFLNLNNSGATNLLLGANEVQEATVVTGGFSGEYGTLAGASVNYITKSGGNDFHGNAIYYWNGRALNANDWFNKAGGLPRSFDNVNQWAGSFGGPIKRDKLFFFVNTEGLRVILPTSVRTLIPTAAYENQVLADLPAEGLSASVPFYQTIFSLYNSAPGASSATVFDDGVNVPNCLGEFSLPGGANCINQFRSQNPNFTHEWQFAGRVDYNFGSKDKMFLRVGYDHGLQATFTDTINKLFNAQSDQPQWQGQFQETHVFNSTLVNQFILSGAWYSAIFTNADRAASLAAFPTTVSWLDGAFTSMGRAMYDWPQGRKVTQYQISDDVSKTLNTHTIKVGVKFRRNDVSDWDYGVYTSGRAYTDLFSFDQGQADLLFQNFANNGLVQPIALYSLAVYGEDDWRIRSNFTLTVALRAEHFSNPVCQKNCIARLTGPFDSVSHDPNQPYNAAINTGLHQTLAGLQSIAWAPRVGFAWQPFGSNHNFVIRGGAGIFYDQFPAFVVDNFSENPPFFVSFFPACFALCGIQGNLSPAETNGGNVYSALAGSNTSFVNGFNAGQTLADIQASNPFFTPPGLFTDNKETKIPQYQKWSLEIQKGFGANTSVTVGYYGNHGIHETIVDPGVNAFNFLSITPGAAVAPDPRFGVVQFVDTHAVSNYNGVTLQFTRRFTGWAKGQISANYTYSKGLDEVSNGGLLPFIFSTDVSPLTPQIPGNYRNNYGPSDYDIRHVFGVNYVWELPIRKMLGGRGWKPLVDGWQLSGAIFAHSGLPYTVIDGSLTGINNYNSTVYPAFLGGAVPSCGENAAKVGAGLAGTPCLSLAQFPAAGTESDFGPDGMRNRWRGPGYTDIDFSFTKRTNIPGWERGEFDLGLQFFNLFNHPNFDLPVNDISNGQFGQITAAVGAPTSILGAFLGGDNAPRLIQIKAEFRF